MLKTKQMVIRSHRYIIEIPDFAAIVVVHGVQNSVPSASSVMPNGVRLSSLRMGLICSRSATRYSHGEPQGRIEAAYYAVQIRCCIEARSTTVRNRQLSGFPKVHYFRCYSG